MSLEPNHVFLVIGMAGTGKTTFCQKLYSKISECYLKVSHEVGRNEAIFSINLDPAVIDPKVPLNEDIREKYNLESVMNKFNLGPNGAVNTALNLYLIQSVDLLEKLKAYKFVIIDTPGQIEAFTWSNPGFFLVESLKTLKNTEIHLCYVIDSDYALKQDVFMANMLYAASLSCRYGLNANCMFNKIDLNDVKLDVLKCWMSDCLKFREDLDDNDMYSPMLGSLALYLDEFYSTLPTYFVGAKNGEGIDEFLQNIDVKWKPKTKN